MIITSLISEKAISLPFRVSPDGNIAFTTDQSRIWADRVKSGLGTILGERIMRSDFGSEVPTLVLDTFSALDEIISSEITSLFANFFPTLVLSGVSVELDETNAYANITVEYTLPNQDRLVTQIGTAILSGNLPIYEENK